MSSVLKLEQHSVDTPRATIYKEAVSLLETTKQWPSGKTYYKSSSHPVLTKSGPINGDFWALRESHLDNIAVARLHQAIIGTTQIGTSTHTDYEPRYVHEISKVEISQLHTYDDGWSYAIHVEYTFPFPLAKRTFNEVVHVFTDAGKSSGLVVSLPIEGALYDHSVLGAYVAVEELIWSEEHASADWYVATTSSAGGFVPIWVTNMSLAGALVKDVPNILKLIGDSKHFEDVE
ncbi:uncharacterized protein LODBEIA_P41750 [Lodderomyces beijingensis]|uniref:DUF3074 domain-containing protein n=1 Tax=Lodderomyces beijingensis TaxID=1775926 RepID=A0ABP0ZS73_9ASCO